MQLPHSINCALITGATSGIGLALVQLLASKGIDLILTGRNENKLQNIAKQLTTTGINVQMYCLDLLQSQDVKTLCQIIEKQTPQLIINSAGMGLYGQAISLPIKPQIDVMRINAQVPLEITLTATRALQREKMRGSVLNISSAAAFFASPYFATYAAAKTFVNQFSLTLDFEMKPYGIRVLVACPGQVNTAFRLHAAQGYIQETSALSMTAEVAAEQIWQQIAQQKPLHIFDWRYRVLLCVSRCLPQRIVQSFLQKSIERRLPPTKLEI